jgi:hypothetical protein
MFSVLNKRLLGFVTLSYQDSIITLTHTNVSLSHMEVVKVMATDSRQKRPVQLSAQEFKLFRY